VQVATQTFPFFEVPNWSVRLVILLVVIGFPVALIIAWAFELGPGGLQRTESSAQPLPKTTSGRGWIYVVIAGAALSISLFFVGRYTAISTRDRADERRTSASVPEKSVAVLPFASLSEDKANSYFADGIQDEILTRLSKIAELKVISRTSTQQYQTKPGNVTEIARQLGVAHILEGSVQKSGDSVRVNVQLIKAEGDSHLWAETYDRKLTDIFAVETEVPSASPTRWKRS
jgi:TolB-like protein